EIERWQDLLKEINQLLSAVSEIVRDKGYPPLIEYNNALGNRKIPKWRGQKIPAKRSERGESLEYLVNPGDVSPLIAQIQLLIELFHFISLMPKAAAGIFPANITSGFQAKLAMQPVTLTTESRKIDWEHAIKRMVQMAFAMLKKYDPETLKIKATENKTIEIVDVALHEMDIIWPENLPQDIAREIQNLVLGIQNGLTSVKQAIDRYNALMGFGSPSDTEKYLEEEAQDPLLNPDRAIKVAKVGAELKNLAQGLEQANQRMTDLRKQMGGGEVPENLKEAQRQANPTNLTRSATSPLPEERRAYPETAREAVPPESKGGKV
ncbi:MAG TPA: phage portal protein, partial [Candidatus Saccharicenans sp.]|nr:phage portal protein [Candidatus Saccharicenans sp.]